MCVCACLFLWNFCAIRLFLKATFIENKYIEIVIMFAKACQPYLGDFLNCCGKEKEMYLLCHPFQIVSVTKHMALERMSCEWSHILQAMQNSEPLENHNHKSVPEYTYEGYKMRSNAIVSQMYPKRHNYSLCVWQREGLSINSLSQVICFYWHHTNFQCSDLSPAIWSRMDPCSSFLIVLYYSKNMGDTRPDFSNIGNHVVCNIV